MEWELGISFYILNYINIFEVFSYYNFFCVCLVFVLNKFVLVVVVVGFLNGIIEVVEGG